MTASTTRAGRLADLRALGLEKLRDRFWELAGLAVEPLAEFARAHTTPSIERSVLLRMGLDSVQAKELVDLAVREGWLGDGVGGVLRRHADVHTMTLDQAHAALLGRTAPHEATRARPERHRPLAPLTRDEPLPVDAILDGLQSYRPRRRGWTWRTGKGASADFSYRQTTAPLAAGATLQAAEYFGGADPQPDCVITAEIASGRFEDDLRRMRMAAWHGADHIMVIRTLGQSHFDGLLEGTPEGIGGVPITRKQLRATRRALDLIEDETGRRINLHSYVSGLAGSEMAVVFAEEGVGGAHQDCQYNILYRNVNPVRSVVDAFEAKRVLADARILQLDGAHNANSTSLKAWNVRPELLVQHALNCVMSLLAGMDRDLVALSTVPPTAPPAPKIAIDLPYALAVRFLFEGYRFRAQQNTRYSTTNVHEAVVLHALDTLISRLTSADIQSTIAPDEARCVPWHHSSVQAVSATKQVLVGLDGLTDLVHVDEEGVRPELCDLVARAVLMLEDVLAAGGYYEALGAGFFVDTGLYPERAGDGIRRERSGGVGAGTVVPRAAGYSAPVCSHFGERADEGCRGCTLCDDALVRFVDELDPTDRVDLRRAEAVAAGIEVVRPEAEHRGDGVVTLSMFLPLPEWQGDAAALMFAERMNLRDARIVDKVVLHPAEGVQYEIAGTVMAGVRRAELPVVPPGSREVDPEAVRAALSGRDLRVVGATLGNDEHSVGLQEVTNIKHRGLEWFGVECVNIGASVLVERLLDEAVEQGACAVLASLVVSHRDIHQVMMRKLHDTAVERGVRDRFLLVAGGPLVTAELAAECGLDGGFGRGTKGVDVARFLLDALGRRESRPAGGRA
ncbi:D-ornithine 4,5-aminomutase subunit OraE [Lentzea sp. NPDC059081]|uniref:D-ornithine 4,5-aminomutase subunit OraE n=1 Tax=Lentzea sp. NPDC059081 TaxID=3346719 RepID=UPI00367A3F68